MGWWLSPHKVNYKCIGNKWNRETWNHTRRTPSVTFRKWEVTEDRGPSFLSNKLQGEKKIEIEREATDVKILQEMYNPTGMYGPYTAYALNIQFVKKIFSLWNRKILTLSIWWYKEISVLFLLVTRVFCFLLCCLIPIFQGETY